MIIVTFSIDDRCYCIIIFFNHLYVRKHWIFFGIFAGNQRRCQAANSLNVFGKYIYNNIAIVFIYFLQKVKQCVLYVVSLINTILKIPFKLKQLFSSIIPYAIQPNQEHVRQRRRNVRNTQRLYQRFLAYGDTFELEQYLREHIPMAKYLMHIFALFWFFVLATCIFIFVRELLLIPLTLIEHGKRKYEYKQKLCICSCVLIWGRSPQ